MKIIILHQNQARAISPAIATVALIAIAITASASVGAYVINQSATLKQDLSAELVEAHLVQLRRPYGTCTGGDWNWGFSFKNTGTVPITNINGQIRQDDGTDWIISGPTPNGAASPGEIRSVSSTSCRTNTITPGRSYQAMIQIQNVKGTLTQSNALTLTIVAEGP